MQTMINKHFSCVWPLIKSSKIQKTNLTWDEYIFAHFDFLQILYIFADNKKDYSGLIKTNAEIVIMSLHE